MAQPSTRRSFSDMLRPKTSALFRNRSKKATETISESGTPAEGASGNTAQLGLFGEDLQEKGAKVGDQLVCLLTQKLYQDHGLKIPSKKRKPTATTAEDMVLEAFGATDQLSPAMISFVKGIMEAMNGQELKQDMEHYTKRRAAQSIAHDAVSLEKRGEEMGNMALESVGKKIHKSKPLPATDRQITAGPSVPVAEPIAEGKSASKPQMDVSHTWPFAPVEDDELCLDPALCGIQPQKRSFLKTDAAAADDDADPDLISMVLSPIITGFNRAFSTTSGVAKQIFSTLSVENIRDGLKCFLYDQYVAFLEMEAMALKLKSFGNKAASSLLEYLADLDEPNDPDTDAQIVRSAATNEDCADKELLPPLLEPILAGILDVLKNSEYRAVRRDAMWSLTRWTVGKKCWGGEEEA